jgi:molybdenum cofactor synthesis domain-containing protein
MIHARVIVASNRAAAGVYPDTSGPLLVDGLRRLGCQVPDPVVVPDGDPVAAALRDAVADGVDVVLTSGGTGITPTDRTPDLTRAVLDYEVPGIAEAIRAHGLATVPTAALSRGLAGVAGTTLVVNLPGSTGGARDGLAVLGPILVHAVDQLRGGDHRPADPHRAGAGDTAGSTA